MQDVKVRYDDESTCYYIVSGMLRTAMNSSQRLLNKVRILKAMLAMVAQLSVRAIIRIYLKGISALVTIWEVNIR